MKYWKKASHWMAFLLIPVQVLSFSGCSTTESTTALAKSDLPREESPPLGSAKTIALASSNLGFALDFYQAVKDQNTNFFYSPYSLSAALAMTYAGARGETAAEMAKVLHFNPEDENLHAAFNALEGQLVTGDKTGKNKDDPQPLQLRIANALWGQQDFIFLPVYLDLLAENYGAGMRLVDFKNAPQEARQQINEWIYRETEEKIKDMLAEGSIVPDTRLVLANAIYFKGDWLFPFAAENTRLEPFFLLDGSQVEADQMAFSRPVTIPYYAGDGFQVVELPYLGEAFNMLVLVPNEGHFAAVEAGLDAEFFEAVLSQLQAQSVSLNMPKFTFDSSFELKDTFSEMGMPAAFENADFSGITGDRSLAIGQVFHNAFVSVDEKGTEAAAVTVVVMVETALIPAVSLTIDRPFMFFILHKPTGSLVFAGRLLDPR